MVDLQKSREKIDEIDKQIVTLFEQRMRISKDVADYKISVNKPVYDRTRELEKLDTLQKLASNDFNRQGVHELFTQIMSISRKLQYTLIQSKQQMEFVQRKEFQFDNKTRVAFFGERGSYTEQAMEEYFGKQVKSYSVKKFKKVMSMLKHGEADYGVLPIENTSTGGITDIYDLLYEYDNTIVGEHIIKIKHALLGLEGATIDTLQTVYSHPQGILQCSKFFEPYDDISLVEFASTSGSAKKVTEDKDPTQAAIASVRAAKEYGLKILAEEINDEETNATRFIIITRKKEFLEHSNKVSICLEVPHESGSLYSILSHFIFNNLSMTKIESRPIKGRSWEYRFFIEFSGNLLEPAVQNAIKGISAEANAFRILGNFHSDNK